MSTDHFVDVLLLQNMFPHGGALRGHFSSCHCLSRGSSWSSIHDKTRKDSNKNWVLSANPIVTNSPASFSVLRIRFLQAQAQAHMHSWSKQLTKWEYMHLCSRVVNLRHGNRNVCVDICHASFLHCLLLVVCSHAQIRIHCTYMHACSQVCSAVLTGFKILSNYSSTEIV